MRTEGMSEHTIKRRLGTIDRIERHAGKPTAELGIDEINRYLARYTAGGTRAAYFGDLAAFYQHRHLTDDDFTPPTQRIKRPRQPKRLPRPITTEQLFLGLDAAEGDVRDWILLGAYQGCRVTEAASVMGQNISGPWIRIYGKGNSDKTIPLQPEVADVATHRPGRGWWFPGTGADGHITAHTVAERVCDLFAGLGVPDFTYHRLRHWCGTEMLRGGASLPEVQQFMRHENISSTVLYTQVLQDELVTAATVLPRPRPHPVPGQPPTGRA